VSNALDEAVAYAESRSIDEFLSEIDLVESVDGFVITTLSGRTDFSVPYKEMLPHLIKNGKMSSDGTKYNTIPLRDKRSMNLGVSSFDVMRQQQKRVDLIRDSLRQRSSRNSYEISRDLRSVLAKSRDEHKSSVRSESVATSSEVKFRTASSRQDSKTQWVIPKQDKDMTQFLDELNARIASSINESIFAIVDSYRKEFS